MSLITCGRIATLVSAALAVAAMSAPVSAQETGYAFRLAAGYSAPGGSLASTHSGGAHVLLGIERGLVGRVLMVRLDGMMHQFNGGDTRIGDQRLQIDMHRIGAASASLLLRVPTRAAAPYLVTGVGYALESGHLARGGMTLNAGLGVDVSVGRAALFAETRFHALDPFADRYAPGGARWAAPISVGVRF